MPYQREDILDKLTDSLPVWMSCNSDPCDQPYDEHGRSRPSSMNPMNNGKSRTLRRFNMGKEFADGFRLLNSLAVRAIGTTPATKLLSNALGEIDLIECILTLYEL
jgi:hypothetical protein